MANLLMLIDKYGNYTEKLVEGRKRYVGAVDNSVIKTDFERAGHTVVIKQFHEINNFNDYKGWNVIYASSEERGLFYKSYIEDIVLGLKIAGANVIPDYRYLHAHENKAFQEVLKNNFNNRYLTVPRGMLLHGNLSGMVNDISFPCVVKDPNGSGSSGVQIARNKEELKRIVNKLSPVKYHDHFYSVLHDFRYNNKALLVIKTFIKKKLLKDELYCNNVITVNKTIVLQEFIPGLSGDYKVLYFASHFYVLRRDNRNNDFRASGSGKFSFPSNVDDIQKVLDFAKDVSIELKDVPMISMDIGQDDNDKNYLLEFQCLGFGPYTQQYSNWYFEYEDETWVKKEKKLSLEEEIVRSILTVMV